MNIVQKAAKYVFTQPHVRMQGVDWKTYTCVVFGMEETYFRQGKAPPTLSKDFTP